jgi:hypothetical protein
MTSRISLRVTLLGLALMLSGAVGVKASHVDNARFSQSSVVAVAASDMAAMTSANILFPFNDDKDRDKKHHVVTPEPASWLYILGAALVVLIWERKSPKSRLNHSESPGN